MADSFKMIVVLTGLLAGTAGAQAAGTCDVSSLSGQYAFKVSGETVGVFDSAGTLHPLALPQPITGVGQYIFDGNGGFTRIDYLVGNGTASLGTSLNDSGFRTGVTGSYTVDTDCTGVITVNIAGGTEIVLAIAVVDYGQGVFGVVKSEHVPGFAPALLPTGTSCGSGCDIGVNLLTELTQNTVRRR